MSIRIRAARFCRFLVVSTLVLTAFSFAQQAPVQPLIVQPVDEKELTVLKGNTHHLAQSRYDRGVSACRSSTLQGMIKSYPCVCFSKSSVKP